MVVLLHMLLLLEATVRLGTPIRQVRRSIRLISKRLSADIRHLPPFWHGN